MSATDRKTNGIFAPPSRPPASAGGRRLLAALAASPAPRWPATAARSKA
jgi:hypothetical protein